MVSRPVEHLDVLIIGAGLSGIGIAVHLKDHHPHRAVALLEARGALGGTWDLFRYPGVRSDSDMSSLGYGFRPWTEPRLIAEGSAILRYLADTAREHGIDERIRYGHRVVAASWSSERARWTVDVELTRDAAGPSAEGAGSSVPPGERPRRIQLSCDVLVAATGYYHYDRGYEPDFPGRAAFTGRVVHPQHWPDDLDHTGARVVVIGSGATAMTLVPALAERAARVTMLQRSPTYVVSMPAVDPATTRLRRVLPDRWAAWLVRWRNIVRQQLLFRLSRWRPELVRRTLLARVARSLPPGYDVARHFTPRYDPWDQRLCLVPDGDLFAAIRGGRVDVVTDEIDTFVEGGIRLRSGAELAADLVVTATGLRLKMFDGIPLTVDGALVPVPDRRMYKGLMLEGVPNFVFAFGYTNASWTLKVDLVGEHLARLLRHLDRHRLQAFVPEPADPPAGAGEAGEASFFDFSSGYVLRGAAELPRQGERGPWRTRMNYLADVRALRFGRVGGPELRFEPVPAQRRSGDVAEQALLGDGGHQPAVAGVDGAVVEATAAGGGQRRDVHEDPVVQPGRAVEPDGMVEARA
ncbi:flavin-containing monooxygenase [Pseudofrankia inefficax]|uniref:FAD dependent oxidoreductase n=1 Tax=Pseudofrankia inefficax (strain DSM 45817 / CECT 9037 / DDB 130130 / EuI1c) TaxID=298654 RepID=E3J6Y9_PSEI1|nr:FAD dependent oxidoreductase [Pseudofrankia inefficax]